MSSNNKCCLKFVVSLLLIVKSVFSWQEIPPWYNELFGDGDFNQESAKDVTKHLSSSTEDLIILFRAERKLVQLLSDMSKKDEAFSFGNSYINMVDYNISDVTLDPEMYVSHPVNAFHLMKRTSNWMPKIRYQLMHLENVKNNEATKEMVKLLETFVLPDKKDFEFGASYGLVSLQDYHNINVTRLAKGIIDDFDSDLEYKSFSKLSSEDLMTIATIGKHVHKLNSQVHWSKAALQAAKEEGRKPAYISKVKKLVAHSIAEHDQEVVDNGFFHMMGKDDATNLVYTDLFPHGKDPNVQIEWRKALIKRAIDERPYLGYENLINLEPRKWRFALHSYTVFRMNYFLFPSAQRLCRGYNLRPPHLTKNLTCQYVHHNNPYLKIGPFKYEKLHYAPEIGLFDDFVSELEMEQMKSGARGQMKSTPYVVTNNNEESYSRFRTSKVLYMNEHKYPVAKSIADKIERAMRFNIYQKELDSENFQVMNYGIGGTISGHVDSSGNIRGGSETYGGTRITTFMVYLSSPQLGGHTIFPQPGISVKPVAGTALYWFNHDNLEENDSRIYHLGCPVAVGNKWITNKWVKWTGQMWNYPCGTNKENFSIHKKD